MILVGTLFEDGSLSPYGLNLRSPYRRIWELVDDMHNVCGCGEYGLRRPTKFHSGLTLQGLVRPG